MATPRKVKIKRVTPQKFEPNEIKKWDLIRKGKRV